MSYGAKEVLRGATFTIHRGEVVALLGPNGAGKSTTIEILEGFRRRSGGQVEVLGVDPNNGNEAWRARLGVVLQSWRDHSRWRTRELLVYLARHYAPFSTSDRQRPFDVDELLDLVGLTEHADARVGVMSGGQRRRLDVAVGLVGKPDLLFLDEPTVGFDPEARQHFHALVSRLAERDDMTILLTTHDLNEAERLADRILVLAGGEIAAEGTATELSQRISSTSEVSYRLHGEPHTHSIADATSFVRELFREHDTDITDLEVRRASLEKVYLSMVRDFEAGHADVPAELSSDRPSCAEVKA
ncbi:ABC transporter ATP-binding protein [Actinoalloteichus spitiensis]|uniref:ABC transporter ATP-binding protein n=1 Tax=Actinoalloteichus spitiensis TaxID=252394 RepID=UPI00068B8481|nr:ABC transporter ATP-binding protein [Actinoalloteichus spitiensis]